MPFISLCVLFILAYTLPYGYPAKMVNPVPTAYEAIKPLRLSAAKSRLFIAEGVAPE